IVEKQNAPAPAVGPHLKARPVAGKWVGADRPAGAGVRDRSVGIVIAVIEDQLEMPLGRQSGGLATFVPRGEIGRSAPVEDGCEVAVRRAVLVAAFAFVGLLTPDARLVRLLPGVSVDDDIALVVPCPADQVGEDMPPLPRVGDPAFFLETI